MSQDKIHEIFSNILVAMGTTGAGVSLNLQSLDLRLSLVVKGISILSFLIYLLINQDKIKTGWNKLITRLYNNLPAVLKKKK